MRVILDLDGILADFIRGIFKHHNKPYPDPWPVGVYNINTILNFNFLECWGSVRSNFWENLPVCRDAHMILETIRKYTNDIHVLTGVPSIHESQSEADAHAAYGKFVWMNRNFPDLAKRMSVTTSKAYAAGPNNLLIDDSDSLCYRFRNHGGQAILIPRPWNSMAGVDVKSHLERSLRDVFVPQVPEKV